MTQANPTEPLDPKRELSKIRRFFSHLLHYGETYIVLPVFVLLVIAAVQAYHYVNQRDQVDDPIAGLIATLNALLPLVLVVSLVGFVQTRVIGYRGHLAKENKLEDDIFDAVVFIALLWSFAKIAHIV